jgi:hypothetical protein
MKIREPHIYGNVNFKSDLSIKEVGSIIGEKIFSGATFGGKENNIYEEVPAIYIDNLMLGFLIVIQGYSGINHESGYWLNITPYFSITNNKKFINSIKYDVCLNTYLYALLDERLKDNPEIMVLEPQ